MAPPSSSSSPDSDEDQDEHPTSGGTPAYDAHRVQAYRADAQPDGTRIMESAPPDTSARPPTSAGVRVADPADGTRVRSSTEMASRSQKERRRERDARAEKTAQRALIGVFLGVGALALVVVNSGYFDDAPAPRPTTAPGASPSAKPSRAPVLKSRPDETPDLPALRSLSTSGLTIAAEGLPEVLAVEPTNPPALLAGIETCRFAYAIWELSPNHAFRFFTTCAAFQGEILVGAYEIEGSQIVMSPLHSSGAELLSVFEVEKPSRMRTQVTIQPNANGPRAILDVRQRITAMRPGMDGEAFFRAYSAKNDVQIAGAAHARDKTIPNDPQVPRESPRAPPKTAPQGGGDDPVLELLKGGQ